MLHITSKTGGPSKNNSTLLLDPTNAFSETGFIFDYPNDSDGFVSVLTLTDPLTLNLKTTAVTEDVAIVDSSFSALSAHIEFDEAGVATLVDNASDTSNQIQTVQLSNTAGMLQTLNLSGYEAGSEVTVTGMSGGTYKINGNIFVATNKALTISANEDSATLVDGKVELNSTATSVTAAIGSTGNHFFLDVCNRSSCC